MKTNDIIYMGSFPHTAKADPAPIAFRVLDVTQDRMLVVSEKCIDARPFHVMAAVRWQNSDIRTILNEVFFFEAFSEEEQKRICQVPVFTGEDVTYDRMFLLSVTEAERYFKTDTERTASATPYAMGRGRWCTDSESCGYWLRDRGYGPAYIADVLPNGTVDPDGDEAEEINGIRPCMWVMREDQL